MRILLVFFLFIPFLCASQEIPSYISNPNEPILATSWTTLVRPTLSNPLTAYYRFVHTADHYCLELKISAGGVPFIVTQNAGLELDLENGEVVKLYNKKWQRACKGCGSKGGNADIPGVTLAFDLSMADVETLSGSYLEHIRLQLPENVLGSRLTLRRTETFHDQADYFLYCIQHQ